MRNLHPGGLKKYILAGFGINRREIICNDFVIFGPVTDPASSKGKKAIDALSALQHSAAKFISRGDHSNTNKKELSLWQQTMIQLSEKEPWYDRPARGCR